MTEGSSHLEEESSSDTLFIGSNNSLDESIIGSMGEKEEDSFGDGGEQSCQQSNYSEEESERRMTTGACTNEGGETSGEKGETKEDEGRGVPTIELMAIDFSNWTVVIFQIECSRILIVIEFINTMKGLGYGGVSLQNMVPIP